MTLSHVRIPADSNGKRLQHSVLIDVGYTSGVFALSLGSIIVGSVSGITGYVIKVTGTVSDGTVRVSLINDSAEAFSTGENLSVDGVVHCVTTGTGTPVYTPSVNLVGKNDQQNGASVSKFGSLQVGFSSGEPAIELFGGLRTSRSYKLANYKNSIRKDVSLFYEDVGADSSITWNSTGSYELLSVGTSAAAKVIKTSHKRHQYTPGVSNKLIITIVCGDSGKTNNIREWGLGDDTNGMFFRLSGSTFGVALRSNTTGIITEEFIPQEDWSHDTLDGTGPSGYNLDITKRNLYWLDYAWLGVGPVRYGVLANDGQLIVAHILNNTNKSSVAYINDGTQPLRIANYNTSSISDSTSELRFICADVEASQEPQDAVESYSDIYNTSSVLVTTDTPVLSARARTTINNKINTVSSYPENLSLYVSGGNVKIDVSISGTLTNSTWGVSTVGPLQGDTAATAITSKRVVLTRFVSPGAHNIPLDNIFNRQEYAVILNGDKVSNNPFTVVATKIDGTTVTVLASLSYKAI
jgi:hypothetical protein